MKKRIQKSLCLLSVLSLAVGCAGVEVKDDQKAQTPAPQAEQKAVELKPVEPPPPPPAPKSTMTIEQKQALRDMEKELFRDVGDYWKLIKERNVEKAVEFVPEAKRESLQQELWRLISLYSVESTELSEKKIVFPAEKVTAEVKLHHLLYDKKTRAFKTSEEDQVWFYTAGKWSLETPEPTAEKKE